MYSPFLKDFVALVRDIKLRKNLPGKMRKKTLRYSHTPQVFMCSGNINADYPTRQQVLFNSKLFKILIFQ